MAEPRQHGYQVKTVWHGGADGSTKTYKSYSRNHAIEADGKPPLALSADPNFRGDPARHNPEELLVASLSACHMLWYLHLCAVNGVEVVDYVDSASGTMEETGGGNGRFIEVVLRPVVTITPDSDKDKAMAQHAPANKQCFIANSVNFPIRHEASVVVADA